ncbi:tetratricopeptide repeat protein [Streptomyces sp. NBC_00191]|uniref:tetratricopeptide repeat protein n=1 Tax=Streptomyces sp. NBC_00191 TaxID=2975674 RepID=UPI00324E8429
MTNYASEFAPAWARNPWVIWPVFAGMALLSVGLGLLSRRLDEPPPAQLPLVGPLASASLDSLRPPHVPVDRVHGRETELGRLTGLLHRPGGRFAVVCAAGGIGKTTVAATLCAQAEEAGYAVFWIRWRDPVALAEHLTRVALACGLPLGVLEQARAGHDNLPDVVWRQLADVRKWLLVIDNADDTSRIGPEPEKVSDYRGWVRPHGGGLLLLTSRDTAPATWGSCAELVYLAPLTARAAGRVLRDAAPGAGTPEEAEALAARLGGLPLALHAAGAYLIRPTSRYRTFTAYQQALEEDLPSLLGAEDPNAADPEVARQVVRHTWELSLDQLAGEEHPLARPLLRLLALYADAPIPLSLITPGLLATATGQTVTQVKLDAALGGLHRYGLLGASDALESGEVPTVALHPLVREINALALTAESPDVGTWRRAVAHRLVAAVAEIRQAGRSGWPTARLLAPHLPFLLAPDGLLPFIDARNALNDLAYVLAGAGLHAERLTLHQIVLDAETRVLDPEHPDTLASRTNLACALNDLGDYAQAADLHRQTLDIRERVLGPEHPHTLASRTNLALALHGLGQHAQAADLHGQTLDARERVLGPEHPDTLASRTNFACALRGLGQYARAADLQRRTLDARQRVLGPEHPDTLASRTNLALALHGLGDYAQAADLHRRTLDARQRVLGPEHPHTLNSRTNLALALHGLGDYAQAADLHRRTLDARQRVLGPENPHTLASRTNLALALNDLGDYAQAADLHRQTLDIRQRVLGPENPHTLASRTNLEAALAAVRRGQSWRVRWLSIIRRRAR